MLRATLLCLPPARCSSAALLVIRGQRGPGQEPWRHHSLEISSACLLWVYFALSRSFVPPGFSKRVACVKCGCYRCGKETLVNCPHVQVMYTWLCLAHRYRLLLFHLIMGDRHVNCGLTPFCSSLTFNPFPCRSSCLSSFFSMVQEKEREREREGWTETSRVQIRQHSRPATVKGYCESVI